MVSPKSENLILDRMQATVGVDTDYALAKLIGKSTSSVHNWRRKGTVPLEECSAFAKQHGVSLDFLVFGMKEVSALELPTSGNEGLNEFSVIPIYDLEAAAGNGRLFEAERIDRHIPLDSRWLGEHGVNAQHVVALTAVGDSMADTVNEGDVILVDRSRTKPDGVFLVRVGDELRIKRVQRMAGGALSLVSDNRKYEPELITPEMLGRGEVEVIGQVFGHLGRVY